VLGPHAMLSEERARELLAGLDLSEEDIEEARTLALFFVDIITKTRCARPTSQAEPPPDDPSAGAL
jgi:hypothetical protein